MRLPNSCKKTIARISSSEFIQHTKEISFEQLGIDELISPEDLASTEIQQLLDQSAFSGSYEFEDGALTLLGTNLEEESPL